MFEDDSWEHNRQERWDRSHVRADGKHYLTAQATLSIEDGEVRQYEILAQKAPNGFFDFLRIVWSTIWHMGMYSNDPTIARMAIVHTAQEQIGVQRQIAAQNRAQDQALATQNARATGQAMADAFFDRLEERQRGIAQ